MEKIEYDKIDMYCRPMVKFFNKIGLYTKFSCEGHNNGMDNNFNIMFDNCVSEEDIEIFLSKYNNQYNHSPFSGRFIKWSRKNSGKIISNWIYEVSWGNVNRNQRLATRDLKIMESYYESI